MSRFPHITNIMSSLFLLDNKGEMPRGWDWVDVVKHVCKLFDCLTIKCPVLHFSCQRLDHLIPHDYILYTKYESYYNFLRT